MSARAAISLGRSFVPSVATTSRKPNPRSALSPTNVSGPSVGALNSADTVSRGVDETSTTTGTGDILSDPVDNPFVGRDGYKSEIFAVGRRNQQGRTFHPDTAALLATEHAVQGVTSSISSSRGRTTDGRSCRMVPFTTVRE